MYNLLYSNGLYILLREIGTLKQFGDRLIVGEPIPKRAPKVKTFMEVVSSEHHATPQLLSGSFCSYCNGFWKLLENNTQYGNLEKIKDFKRPLTDHSRVKWVFSLYVVANSTFKSTAIHGYYENPVFEDVHEYPYGPYLGIHCSHEKHYKVTVKKVTLIPQCSRQPVSGTDSQYYPQIPSLSLPSDPFVPSCPTRPMRPPLLSYSIRQFHLLLLLS